MPVPICDICSKSYRSISKFVHHFRTHSDKQSLQCRFCGMRTKHPSSLSKHETHYCRFRNASQKGAGLQSEKPCQCQKCSKCRRRKLVINNANRFNCDNCDRSYSTLKSLAGHMKERHWTEQLHCKQCRYYFNSHYDLHRHAIVSHFASADTSAACHDCDKTFPSSYHLLAHIKNIHNRLANKCTVCQKNYDSYHRLKTHHCINFQRVIFKCDICEKKFTHRNGCTSHVAFVHVSTQIDSSKRVDARNATKIEGQRVMLQCSKCVKLLTTQKTLQQHERQHAKLETSADAECLRCQMCDKMLCSKQSLDSHLRRHKERSRFACSLCQRVYSTSNDLKRHVRTQHGGQNSGYRCDLCDKTFFSAKFVLSEHAKLHHIRGGNCSAAQTAIKTDNSRAQFQCSICVQQCASRHGLRCHELLHSKNRTRFTCQFCDWTTTFKNSLMKHERRHKKPQELFVCFNCEKKFAELVLLKVHLKYLHDAADITHQCDLCNKAFTGPLIRLVQHIYGKHQRRGSIEKLKP